MRAIFLAAIAFLLMCCACQAQELLPIEKQLALKVNEARAVWGMSPLKLNWELQQSARNHANQMAWFNRLEHSKGPYAENIAQGHPSVDTVMRGWMTSPGHKANVLNPRITVMGVSVYQSRDGTNYWCQQFK